MERKMEPDISVCDSVRFLYINVQFNVNILSLYESLSFEV